ncbi:hypothetical protein H7Y63_01065 [Polaromonas sp.]|nr:hypothetical protein [Candidatus Saccharibacteria bacterium]
MTNASENQFPPATTEQIQGWLSHDLQLLRGGAELVDGNIHPTAEQHVHMKQIMISEFTGRTAVGEVIEVRPILNTQEADQDISDESVTKAAAEGIGKVMRIGFSASPESIKNSYLNKSIVPKSSEGEVASKVIGSLPAEMRRKITPEQMKWFTLGLATQAHASESFGQNKHG